MMCWKLYLHNNIVLVKPSNELGCPEKITPNHVCVSSDNNPVDIHRQLYLVPVFMSRIQNDKDMDTFHLMAFGHTVICMSFHHVSCCQDENPSRELHPQPPKVSSWQKMCLFSVAIIFRSAANTIYCILLVLVVVLLLILLILHCITRIKF
jgi:hypothetical protein